MPHVEIACNSAACINEHGLLSDVTRSAWAIMTEAIRITFDLVTHNQGRVAIIEVDIETTTEIGEIAELVIKLQRIRIFISSSEDDLIEETRRGGVAFDLFHLLQSMTQDIITHAMRNEMHLAITGVFTREVIDKVFELEQSSSKSESGHFGVVAIGIVAQHFAIGWPTEDDDIVGAVESTSELSTFLYGFVEIVIKSMKVNQGISTTCLHVATDLIKERHRPLLGGIRKDDRLLCFAVRSNFDGANPQIARRLWKDIAERAVGIAAISNERNLGIHAFLLVRDLSFVTKKEDLSILFH